MKTLHFYVNEHVNADRFTLIRADLLAMAHVKNVQLGKGTPQELMVDVDEHCDMAINVMEQLTRAGLNPEISYS